jgi:Ca-activated chloride channel homolog
MQSTMMRSLSSILATLLCATAARADEHVILVLDASGSMWGQIDGRSKIEIARGAVSQLTADWPAADAIGLVAYGHRSKGDCSDIETLLPLAPLDAAAFNARVAALNPMGMTPISAAVRHAAAALKYTEQKATVILVSDGEETCKADPCAVADELEAQGVDFTAHVIGFDVGDAKAQAQLRCLAENTGGHYRSARSAAELGNALDRVVQDNPPLPPATATLKAPSTVAAALPIRLRWSGPADAGDWIGFATSGSAANDYLPDHASWTSLAPGEFDIELHAPATAGIYELRYVSPDRQPAILATQRIEVTAQSATLSVAATVMAFDTVRIQAQGPAGDGHWVGFAPRGGGKSEYIGGSWTRVDASGSTDARVTAPEIPGTYEVRYVLNEGDAVIASTEVRVSAAVGRLIDPPVSADAQQPLEIRFEGPRNPGGGSWIGLVPRGGGHDAYLSYCYLPETGPCRFTPTEPGSFDLVYVVGGSTFLDRQPIEIR